MILTNFMSRKYYARQSSITWEPTQSNNIQQYREYFYFYPPQLILKVLV